MMMPGRMVNGGGPHGSGQMGMGPQMGGMPQMSHPMGPPGVPPNMTVSIFVVGDQIVECLITCVITRPTVRI